MDGLTTVKWSELLPYEFHRRIRELPIVYLPVGLCEPHGQVAALGLDLLKAEHYCEAAARRFGGIVALDRLAMPTESGVAAIYRY